jgi:hypothetical protein
LTIAVPAPSRTVPTAQPAKLSPRAITASATGLGRHAGGDQVLAADPVREDAGDELPDAPYPGVEREEQADLPHREVRGREQEREDAPGQPDVEVVDQPRLARRGQGGLAQARPGIIGAGG